MTPKSEAIAYRAWVMARERGWDCTIAEIADEMGLSAKSLGAIMQHKGWVDRFRAPDRTWKREIIGSLNGGMRDPMAASAAEVAFVLGRQIRAEGLL